MERTFSVCALNIKLHRYHVFFQQFDNPSVFQLFDRLNYDTSNHKLQFGNSDGDDDNDDDDETNNNNIGTGILHSFCINAFLCTNAEKYLQKMLKRCNFQDIISFQFRI